MKVLKTLLALLLCLSLARAQTIVAFVSGTPVVASPATPAMFQHVAGGSNPANTTVTCNTVCDHYKLPFINASGAGNTLILAIWYPNGQTPSVSGVCNTWPGSPTVSASGGASHLDAAMYVLPNAAACLETLTVTFGASVPTFGYKLSEFYNLAPSPINGTKSSAFQVGASLTTGSFTPTTNNDANGGNLIWNFCTKAEGATGAATTPTAISAGGSFTLLDADIGWAGVVGQPSASSFFVQTAQAAVNPAITVTGDTDHYNCLAIALKALSAGNAPPAGIRVAKILHFTTISFPGSGSYKLQVPPVGNLRVIACDDPALNTLTISDSDGTYTTTAASAGIWFLGNQSADATNVMTISGGGGDVRLSWRFVDIVGASASPFDTFAVSNIAASGQTSITTPTVSPSNSSGIVIANVGLGQGPGLAVTAPAGARFDLAIYGGETDFDDMENADLMAHYHNTASGPFSFTWTITNQASNSTSGGAAAFK